MIPKNLLPLSPWNFNTFSQCPAKFWYQKNWDIKPFPQKPNDRMFFGNVCHSIQSDYYNLLLKEKDFSPEKVSFLYQKAVNMNRNNIEDIQKYNYHLSGFEKFEIKRLQWSEYKPISIESKIDKGSFRGKVDAIFKSNKGETVVIDWKTGNVYGEYFDSYCLQGYIYKYVTNADKVMFFTPLRRQTITITDEQLNKGRDMIVNILQEIESCVNNRNKGEWCKDCEYNLVCKFSELGIKLDII